MISRVSRAALHCPNTPINSTTHDNTGFNHCFTPTMDSLVHSRKNRSHVQPFFQLSLLFLLNHQLQISNIFVNAASNVHIVYLGERQHDDPAIITNSHHDMLAKLLGSREAALDSIVYSYKHGFSGFAAKLTKSQADIISDFDGVVHVIPNRIHKMHTTRSWEFLGLNSHPGNLLSESNMGDGIIIGVIDSGIWPESDSFSDKNMGPIPSRWKGICQHGQLFNSSNCNRKLIGARWFIKGQIAELGDNINITEYSEFLSPRDAEGHGTHTSSTAGGNLVENASVEGLGKGIARGGAPRSRIAMYKTCWNLPAGCADADMLKAFDEAIHDGVDVLSVSVGGQVPVPSYIEHDGISLGSFHAVANGITVVCSAGNDGPFAQTIINTAPWMITVAASTIDRIFPTAITLGNNKTLLGQSMDVVRKHKKGFRGLVYSEHIGVTTDSGSTSCKLGSLNGTLAAGKVVLCFSITDEHEIDEAVLSVAAAGGVAIIFAQYPNNLLSPRGLIPCIEVNYQVGTEILSYIEKARSPLVKLGRPKTIVGNWVSSPRVAYFSSRGPSSLSPTVLKPDIAAPGVGIIAASPTDSANGGFTFGSGTSMACPHVAGIAALIKSLHPDWSPAAIKSAFVTTATTTDMNGDPITAEGGPRKQADPFDYGGGHINPSNAADPGLIYDMSMDDYVQFLCSMGYNNSAIASMTTKPTSCPKNHHSLLNLNLPSISVPNLKKRITISRTVTNVGPINSQYKALVQSPPGIKIMVEPPILIFNTTTIKITFRMTISSTKVQGDYSFGSLTWSDGDHLVRSPIVVRAVNFYTNADK